MIPQASSDISPEEVNGGLNHLFGPEVLAVIRPLNLVEFHMLAAFTELVSVCTHTISRFRKIAHSTGI